MISGAEIASVARAWVGVPFQHQGRNRFGVDCVGLLVVVARELGIPHRDFVSYGLRSRSGLMESLLAEAGLARIPIDAAVAGDVLSFWWEARGVPYHAAVVAERDGHRTIVHAVMDTGRVVETTLSGRWLRRAVCGWRYPLGG